MGFSLKKSFKKISSSVSKMTSNAVSMAGGLVDSVASITNNEVVQAIASSNPYTAMAVTAIGTADAMLNGSDETAGNDAQLDSSSASVASVVVGSSDTPVSGDNLNEYQKETARMRAKGII